MLSLHSLRRRWPRFLRRRTARTAQPRIYASDIKDKPREEWQRMIAEDPEEAARWMYAAATAGYVDAQLSWAQMQLDGLGTPRDPQGAFRWFEIAAQSQRPDAVNMLGRCHELGWGTPADAAKAADCYRIAADMSFDWAQFNLATLMLEGRGVPRDPDTAFALFLRAAEQGHVKSFHMVGLFHENGFGRPHDLQQARDWYRRAAEAGERRGQYHYGLLLVTLGEEENGLTWLRRAADGAPDWFVYEKQDELAAHPSAAVREIGAAMMAASPAPAAPAGLMQRV
jgi:TPR repeat protein